MKNLVLLSVLLLFAIPVSADNLFQSNNPFPNETGTPDTYNIYSSNPSAIKKDTEKQKKFRFGRKQKFENTTETQFETPVNEGVQGDGSFYIFK